MICPACASTSHTGRFGCPVAFAPSLLDERRLADDLEEHDRKTRANLELWRRRLAAGFTPCSCDFDHHGDCSNPKHAELPGQTALF